MTLAVFAQKLGMTQIYDEKSRHIPVTILRVPAQVITAVRTKEKDTYSAIQIGAVAGKHLNKAQREELRQKNINLPITRRREIRLDNDTQVTSGDPLSVQSFSLGDEVIITGKSKGKGFAGGIKRHGWSRGPMSHGSKHHRAPGSIGSGYPQRVVPGKKLPGHLGAATVTVKGCKIVAINEQDNTLAVSGAIPGAPRSLVFIRKQVKE